MKAKAISIIAILSLFILSCGKDSSSSDEMKYSNPAGKDMPVMAWFTLYGPHLDASHFKDLSDAGFNLAFSFISDIEELDRVLDGAKGSGVKVIASCDEMKSDPQGTVRHLKKNRSVAAYFIKDEPFAKDLDTLANWFNQILETDDSRLLYCNLNPTYCPGELLGFDTYEDYVSAYCEKIDPLFLSFDHYPVLNTGLRPDFWYNLEVISSEARKRNIPFWGFALSTAHAIYPIATYESMGLQIWSNLAYGAQGIEYFTFLSSLDDKFHDGPIDSKGERTPVYQAVSRLNSEVQSLKDVFLGDEVVGVWHTGEHLPTGTSELVTMPVGVNYIKSEDKGVLVSEIHNSKKVYLMVVNHDYESPQTVTIGFEKNFSMMFPSEFSGKIRKGTHDFEILPGGMLLFRVK